MPKIQELTDKARAYMESKNNPADDITHGKSLQALVGDSRWILGLFSSNDPQNSGHFPQIA